MNDHCQDCHIYKTDQKMQFEELGINYYDDLLQAENAFNRDEAELQL